MANWIEWEKGGFPELVEEYYIWLVSSVGYDESCDDLLRLLFHTEFTWVIPMDSNRAAEGRNMRSIFCNENSIVGEIWDDQPCSVLEMLVALANYIENNLIGDPDLCIFWRMLDNLNLLHYRSRTKWIQIIDRWLNREFDSDGMGSIFPIYNAVQDYREIDIWGQCMDWLYQIGI